MTEKVKIIGNVDSARLDESPLELIAKIIVIYPKRVVGFTYEVNPTFVIPYQDEEVRLNDSKNPTLLFIGNRTLTIIAQKDSSGRTYVAEKEHNPHCWNAHSKGYLDLGVYIKHRFSGGVL